MVEKIKADLKKIRRGKVFAAIISLVIGVVLLVYPMTSLEVIVRMIGIALIISGLYECRSADRRHPAGCDRCRHFLPA